VWHISATLYQTCGRMRRFPEELRPLLAPERSAVPVKIAQEQLGHASISTTLNIYIHVVDASHRRAVEAIAERLFVELDPHGPKLAIVPWPAPTGMRGVASTEDWGAPPIPKRALTPNVGPPNGATSWRSRDVLPRVRREAGHAVPDGLAALALRGSANRTSLKARESFSGAVLPRASSDLVMTRTVHLRTARGSRRRS
jgi:hypothetical protein